MGIGATAMLVACGGVGTEHATAPAAAISGTEVQASEDIASVSANDIGTTVADYQETERDIGLATAFGLGEFNLQLGGPVARGNLPPGMGGPQANIDPTCPVDSVGFTYTFPKSDPTDTISYARTWQAFSAKGCERRFVADSTDSVATTFAFVGDFNGDAPQWAGHHHGGRADAVTGVPEPGTPMVLSTSPMHVWNGKANTFDSVAFQSTSEKRMHRFVAFDTTSNVTLPNPRRGDCYPLSGTWTRWLSDTLDVTGTSPVSKTYDLHLVLTFTSSSPGMGSQYATLQVYDAALLGSPLIKTCTVDLRGGNVVSGSCH
jgi:hypothetical protein